MKLKLRKDVEQQLQERIQRYLTAEMGEEVGSLRAGLFLRFVLEELAPGIYQQAISDAQAYLQERVADLDNVCFLEEPRAGNARRVPSRR